MSNNSSQYQCNSDSAYLKILYPAGYGVVFTVGLVLNVITLYFILFRVKHWSPNTIYMVNLTVCDILYILTLPFLIYYHRKDSWPFNDTFCKLVRFFFHANLYGSILFLGCISLHRFLVICHSVRSMHQVSIRRAQQISVGMWVAILLVQAPILYFSQIKQKGKRWSCYNTSHDALFKYFYAYNMMVLLLFFVLPFMVVLVCYKLMLQKLLKPGAAGQSTKVHFKQKSVKMIIIVLLAFILCFLPYHVTRSLLYTFRLQEKDCWLRQGMRVAYHITRVLASANSIIDPVLYFMAGQGFRKSIKKSFKKVQKIEKSEDQNTQEMHF